MTPKVRPPSLSELRRQVIELGTVGLGMVRAEVLVRVYADTGAPLSELGREQLVPLLARWRRAAGGGRGKHAASMAD